jgi:hypothetical protein
MPSFDEWFKRATGNYPFPYQRRFATEGEILDLVTMPAKRRNFSAIGRRRSDLTKGISNGSCSYLDYLRETR